MEPEVRQCFERIEPTLAVTAKNHRAAMELDKRRAASNRRAAIAGSSGPWFGGGNTVAKGLILVPPGQQNTQTPIPVVLNWQAELKR
jgi:hypothetical protein